MLQSRLGRKQNSKNEDWVWTMKNIEKLRTEKEIMDLVHETAEEVIKETKWKRSAYGWSGGKDSIALQVVCETAGINLCIHARTDELEYPAFEEWVERHKPDGCSVYVSHHTLEWLQENQHMLFPTDSKISATWFRQIQHKIQAEFYQDHELDLIILGRRKQDGNFVGRGTNIYTNREGITRYSPLADWKHEDILGVIHYYNMPLPPIYNYVNGYVVGTGAWPMRTHCRNHEIAWDELYHIDPNIVGKASRYIEGAKDYLKTAGWF